MKLKQWGIINSKGNIVPCTASELKCQAWNSASRRVSRLSKINEKHFKKSNSQYTQCMARDCRELGYECVRVTVEVDHE